MNFKDIYSSANDELHGKADILEKLLSADSAKKRSPLSFFIPTAAAAVAVAAVMIMNPQILGIDKENPSRDFHNTQIASIDPKTAEPSYENDTTELYKDIEISAPESETLPITENPALPKQDVTPSAESMQIAQNAPKETEESVTVEVMPASAAALNINLVDELAGSEPVVAQELRIVPQYREMSYNEYSEYIGKDIAAEAEFSGDMILEVPESVSVVIDSESGEIVSDRCTYLAHSEDFDRFAEITVSRTDDLELTEEGFEKSEIKGNSVLILSDGTDFNASFTDNGTDYIIRTGGVTQEELTNLLISLNGGNNYE